MSRVVGRTGVASRPDVFAVIIKSSMLPRSRVASLTCCTKPDVSSKSARLFAFVHVESLYLVLKSPHTIVAVGLAAAINNTLDTSSRKVLKH